MTYHPSLKSICLANGDGGTGRGATLARETIFRLFPTEDVSVYVTARLDTGDTCIDQALAAFRRCGAGFKNSTASDDPRIKARGMKSANIVLRPRAGAYALLRLLQATSEYPHMSGILRFACGGFYDERDFQVVQTQHGGPRVGRIIQEVNISAMTAYAKLALRLREERALRLILASKSTIARSEEFFRKEVESVWMAAGLTPGVTRDKGGNIWTNDYHHELTDVALASIPMNARSGTPWTHAPFLGCFDNPNGDSASDILEFQCGARVMGSQVCCQNPDGSEFSYEELPGGTADGKTHGSLRGNNFLDPTSIIFALCSAYERVNPEQKAFFDAVRRETLAYCNNTPKGDRDTEALMDAVGSATESLLVLPA